MAYSDKQQIFELVNKSSQILIIFKKDWNGDVVSASLAMAEFFKKLGKKADVVCHDFKQSPALSYLPLASIQPQLDNLQKFIVSVDIEKTGLGEFEYKESASQLNFYITPKNGKLSQNDVTTAISGFKYDLVFLINTPDLEALGGAYDKHPDFFYSIAKINIDHSAQNEYYGNINLVNIAASSSAELVYDLINDFDSNLIDDNIATYILSGIIASTKNFKTTAVTPRTLNLAGSLISKGARRDQIIQSLYQSRFLSTLKLWGRVLSRLNNDLNDKIIWSALAASDFLETSTNPDELPDVVEELIVSMPKTEIVVLLFEEKRGEIIDIQTMVYAVKNRDAIFIASNFNPSGNKSLARFVLANTTLAEAQRQVIEEVKKQLV
jgi:nanoRNase/pAp phosphatase (c-di-AMP/oligoRNAs hydrolase)